MSCPFCDSSDVEDVAAWGGQLMTAQLRCRACGAYFESVREEFATADGEEFATADGEEFATADGEEEERR